MPRQRTTEYGAPSNERVVASFAAPPLAEIVNTPLRRGRTQAYDAMARAKASPPVAGAAD
jgi:hypothetical protein